ncbi:MAG: DUF2299 family protein [Promethearchaeota archaeon]|jgi:hypothetical protein
MSNKESKIKHSIQEYLLDEGLLRKKISDDKLEFGFQFIFPPGNDPTGRPIGRNMVVIKPKKKNLIVIILGTQIANPHIDALNSLKEDRKMQFYWELRKFFLIKDLFYRIDINNYRYEISDQIFLKNDGSVSKNNFFKSIRRVFDASAYSNIILGEYCSGKIRPEDFIKSKDFAGGSDFSLYS